MNIKRSILTLWMLFSMAHPVLADRFLSDEDRQIVVTCLVLEAGGEGFDGMLAVLNVILNRAQGDLDQMVPKTIKSGAFSSMSSVWNQDVRDYTLLFQRAERQPVACETAHQLIDLLEDGCLWDNTQGATHFHSAAIHPYWADDLHYLLTIGNHKFYLEKNRTLASL